MFELVIGFQKLTGKLIDGMELYIETVDVSGKQPLVQK